MAALLDGIFDPQTYAGVQGLLSRLFPQGLQVPTAPGQPDQTPTGPTFARGNFGSMGGVPFPIMPGGPAQGPTTMDLSAQSQQPQMPPQQMQQPAPMLPTSPAQPQSSDLLQRLQAGATNFTTGGNPIAGLLNSIAGFSTGQRTDRMGMMLAQQQATAQALQKSGVPAPLSVAAALNPDVLKQIAPEYFGGYKLVQTGESPVGKTFMLQGPGGKLYPIGGTSGPGAISDGSGGGGSSGGIPGVGNTGMLASGVKQYNPNLSGEEYLAQFSPELQAAAKAYMNGDVMPTGNPRQQGIVTLAKTIAQKYGQDMGIPVNDQTFAEKRKMQTEIASSGQGTMGGILSNGKSAFEHLLNYSNKLAELNNASGPEVPGGGHLGTATNFVTNSLFPSPDTKAKIASVNDNGLRYGQESTKFYSATGGGEAERMNALRENNAKTTTAAEQAGFLQTEKELMLGRLRQKEAQIRNTLGQDYLNRHPVFDKNLQDMLDGIDKNIAQLRGQTPPSSSPAQTSKGGVIDYREYFK